MNEQVWRFDILRATSVGDLEDLRADLLADETLASDEKDDLCRVIREKISRLAQRVTRTR